MMDVVGQASPATRTIAHCESSPPRASQATRVDGHCDIQLEAGPPKTLLDAMPNKRLQPTRFAGG
jgi:hypothetical protein